MRTLTLHKNPLEKIDQRKFLVDIELSETIDLRDYIEDIIDIEMEQEVSFPELAETLNKEYTYIEIAEFINTILDMQVNSNLLKELGKIVSEQLDKEMQRKIK